MKNLSFLFLVTVMALGVVAACGKKEESSSAARGFSSNPYQVSTVEGYLDIQQPTAQVGNTTYQLSQQSQQVALQAMSLAHQQGIQPVMVNGVQKLRARLTGSVGAVQNQYPQQYPQQQYPQQGGNVLNLTQAVIHR